jgi:alkylated DNA repair protein (DNA oxidative demethylase)
MSLLFPEPDIDLPAGARLFRQRLSLEQQQSMLDDVAQVLAEAPPFRPQMPTGPYMINSLTNCGDLGWVSDRRGYRYEPLHPETGKPWPAIPASVRDVAIDCALEAGFAFEPDACLVNIYAADGRLSLHRDYDEADYAWPIVSFSLGNDADFQLAGLKRSGPSTTFTLHSGDVFVFGGESRLRYHGVRRIRSGTSPLRHPILPEGGRINLTLRRAR